MRSVFPDELLLAHHLNQRMRRRKMLTLGEVPAGKEVVGLQRQKDSKYKAFANERREPGQNFPLLSSLLTLFQSRLLSNRLAPIEGCHGVTQARQG
jgi:hypothetical protein